MAGVSEPETTKTSDPSIDCCTPSGLERSPPLRPIPLYAKSKPLSPNLHVSHLDLAKLNPSMAMASLPSLTFGLRAPFAE